MAVTYFSLGEGQRQDKQEESGDQLIQITLSASSEGGEVSFCGMAWWGAPVLRDEAGSARAMVTARCPYGVVWPRPHRRAGRTDGPEVRVRAVSVLWGRRWGWA